MSSTGEPVPIPPWLAGNHEFVRAAVAQCGGALRFAAAELKGDREVVLAAVAQNGHALDYATAELKGDREFVLEAVARKGIALQYAAPELMGDREVVLAAVAQDDAFSLASAAVELRGDREVVLAAVTRWGPALQYASWELRRDREVVLAAVAQYGPALRFAASELRTDPLLCKVRSLNPRLSAHLVVAQLRLCLAYACHERVGCESLWCLLLEVIELVGHYITTRVVVHGVALHSVICRPTPPTQHCQVQ